ncbi:MAG: hypothetical protein IH897_01330 [Planctomycetes bacterium]|nr:hypothetical protein [Planctomycetota bacterium]
MYMQFISHCCGRITRGHTIAGALLVTLCLAAPSHAGTQACCDDSNDAFHCYRDDPGGAVCVSTSLGGGSTCVADCGCGPTCPSTVEPTKGNGSITRITFLGTTLDGPNTKYSYHVCKLAGADLSHWVLGTDCCNNIVSSSAPPGESPGTSCGTDPTTGLFGVKFDETSPLTDCASGTDLYTITISGPPVTGCIKVATKANGLEDIATACIAGPVCPDCPSGICDPGEDKCSCPDDCGAPVCGDDVCECDENQSNCCQDCGCASLCETCNAATGSCEPVVCTNMLDECNNAACDPATGLCTVPDPKPLSTECEADGDLCTPDHCDGAGNCVPDGPPVTCTNMLDECNNAACDPATGLCTVPVPKPLSTTCEADGDSCTADHCDGNGNCVFNAPNFVCGDGVCECGEDCSNCPLDCATGCGDGCCTGLETTCNCPSDCPGACCGNNIKEPGEECDGTDADACEDGICSASCNCGMPAVSEWGLIALVLLLLTGLAIKFGQYRRQTR